MQRLSSNLTLILKIVVPISWVSFFGLFGVVLFVLNGSDEPFLTSIQFRTIYVIWFLTFATLIYFTLFQLKRVETQDGQIFMTDYFKTVKFPLENIKKISVLNLGLLKIGRMHLHNKGIFGSKVPFILKTSNFNSFKNAHPSIEVT